MNTLLENPMPVIFVGIVAVAVLGVILAKTGRGIFLVAIVGVLLLVLAGVGLEALVVTDHEQVEATIDGGAAAFVDGNIERVLRFIAPDAPGVQTEARLILREGDFDAIKITDLQINIIPTTSPPTARVKLIAVVTGRYRSGDIPVTNQVAPVELKLRREGDRWVVYSFQRGDIAGGL